MIIHVQIQPSTTPLLLVFVCCWGSATLFIIIIVFFFDWKLLAIDEYFFCVLCRMKVFKIGLLACWKCTSIVCNTNTILATFSRTWWIISHNRTKADMKAFSSLSHKPVWDLCSWLVSLQRSVYQHSHQSPQTSMCLRLAPSFYHRASVHLVAKRAHKICLFAISVWICLMLTAAMWKPEDVSESLAWMGGEIREIGRVWVRIQDVPITHFHTSNLPPLSDKMENLSVCVNKLCLPDCICVFYFLASAHSADGGKDCWVIDIHSQGAALLPDMTCLSNWADKTRGQSFA